MSSLSLSVSVRGQVPLTFCLVPLAADGPSVPVPHPLAVAEVRADPEPVLQAPPAPARQRELLQCDPVTK